MSSFPTPDFAPEVLAEIKEHAVDQWPKESCGIIAGGIYQRCDNIAEDPTKGFRIKDSVIFEAGASLEAVIHSHPEGGTSPSHADMVSQMSMDCIFGLIPCNKNEAFDITWWGDFLLETPLIGQRFVHGVTDCFTVVRGYFWQVRGLKLPDLPRDKNWWEGKGNLYVENFERMGFEQIDSSQARDGDCFIGKVRSDVPNHGGVILDRGLGLHHLDGRLSRREPINRWSKFITHYLRYKEEGE